MKIKIDKIPDIPLGVGLHKVVISNVQEGKANGIYFFSCKFKNENGFFNQNFYLTDRNEVYIASLFKSVDIDLYFDKYLIYGVDSDVLLNKELIIKISPLRLLNPNPNCFHKCVGVSRFIPIDKYDADIDNEYNDYDDFFGDTSLRSDDPETYCGDPEDFRYGGYIGEYAWACWLNTN